MPPARDSVWLLHQNCLFPSSRSPCLQICSKSTYSQSLFIKGPRKLQESPRPHSTLTSGGWNPSLKGVFFPMPLSSLASQIAKAAMTHPAFPFRSLVIFILSKVLPSLHFKVSIRVYVTKTCLALGRWISQNEKGWLCQIWLFKDQLADCSLNSNSVTD